MRVYIVYVKYISTYVLNNILTFFRSGKLGKSY